MAKKEEKTESELVQQIAQTGKWIERVEALCEEDGRPLDSPNRLADRAKLQDLRDELAAKRNVE